MADFSDKLKPRYDGSATLKQERDRSAIDAQELAKHLLSRDGFLERQERVVGVLSKEKLFKKDQQMNLSRPERYQLGLARAKAIRRIGMRGGWDMDDYKMAEYVTDEVSPFHLHMTMFGEPILSLA
jgi:acyl-CoA oxidase